MTERRRFLFAVSTISLGGLAGYRRRAAEHSIPRWSIDNASSADDQAVRVAQFVGKSHGDLDTVKRLLADDPTLVRAAWDWGDGDWETGLSAASHMGRRDIAELILEYGACVDAGAAAMLGYSDVLAAMIRARPNLHESRGSHQIPLLSHAIMGGELADKNFEMLMAAGADVNASSLLKITPLMTASYLGRHEHVESLLDQGADPLRRNSSGQSALDIAKKRKRTKAIELLRRATSRQIESSVER